MYVYSCVAGQFPHPELGAYSGYGIKVLHKDTEIRYIPDISLNKESLEVLVDKCNQFQLNPVHLDDIVEDFLADC